MIMTPGKLVRKKLPLPPPAPAAPLRRKQTKMAQPQQEPQLPIRERVPRNKRRPGWPEMSDDIEDTEYVVAGNDVVSFVTDCKGLAVGWDLCGRCVQHVSNCRCPWGVVPPRSIVYIWRSTHGIEQTPETMGGSPYVGMRHDPRTKAALPMDFVAPAPRRPAAVPAPEPAPVTTTLPRRKPQAATQPAVPRTKNVQGKAGQISSKLVRRTSSRKGG